VEITSFKNLSDQDSTCLAFIFNMDRGRCSRWHKATTNLTELLDIVKSHLCDKWRLSTRASYKKNN